MCIALYVYLLTFRRHVENVAVARICLKFWRDKCFWRSISFHVTTTMLNWIGLVWIGLNCSWRRSRQTFESGNLLHVDIFCTLSLVVLLSVANSSSYCILMAFRQKYCPRCLVYLAHVSNYRMSSIALQISCRHLCLNCNEWSFIAAVGHVVNMV